MSMTDELRLMLDERGVKWSADDILSDCYTEWSTDKHTGSALELNGRVVYSVGNVSVTETVDATLWRSVCEIEELNDGWYCTACGDILGSFDPDSELYIDGNVIETWDYCPSCGRKVKR